MATESSLELVIHARIEHQPDLAHWVEKLAVEFLLPQSLSHRIDLCLTELVSNVISYGYPEGKIGTVRIRCWREPEQIVIRLDDDAIPFDPTSCALPGLPSSLDDATSGGRGIRLVRHFTDELHHVRTAEGNQLTLVFRSLDTGTHLSAPEGTASAETPKATRQPL
jgi:anti-sigma regulatory factor (Ser/Thr protein kinase)